MGAEGFGFGRKGQNTVLLDIIEGFDAKSVARQCYRSGLAEDLQEKIAKA